MRLSMNTRQELTCQVAQRYRMATNRKEKSQMLTEFVQTAGYNRSYAATLLRGYGKKIQNQKDGKTVVYHASKKKRKGGGRPIVYTQPVRDTIQCLWMIFGCKCGKLLVPIIRNNIDRLRTEKPVSELHEEECNALKKVSPSTVDRILKDNRRELKIKGSSYTRPNTALLSQIPIRTFGDWENVPPGHFQIDCVGHDGGMVSGQCCFTLTAVDVSSGWCERQALLNRAHRWVIEALDLMRADCPIPFVEIHPDNGSEFINYALIEYCKDPHLGFSRSRPGKKNDNCYVEQKNFDAVRKLVGYARYSTPEALSLLNELYQVQGVLQNYIYPAFKLEEKTRVGSRYIKKHNTPKTPAMRLLEDPRLDQGAKERIRKTLENINPIAVALEVNNLQKQLLQHAEILASAYPEGKGA
jgi:hypothetical protein